jgi:hypothetical protein
MSEWRVYNIRRARISVQEIKFPRPSYRTALKQIAEYSKEYARLKALGQQSNADIYRREIQTLRRRMRTNTKMAWFVKVELTEPRFGGFSHTYEFNSNEEQTFAHLVRDRLRATIRQFREYNTYQEASVALNGYYATMIGSKRGMRVFARNGTILKMHIKKNMRSLYEDKKPPVVRTKYIGVELEFCAPISEEKLALKLFQAGIHKFAQLKQDGSLRPQDAEIGYELAVLLPEQNYKADLKVVLDVLKSIKATATDRRCGFHVHLDMRNRNKDRVFHNLVSCQKVLFKLVDPARYGNEFCQIVNSKKMPINFTGQRQERYKTINAAAYYKYRTLEVRMHEGSVDYDQIVGWIDLLIKIANYRKLLKENISKLTILKKRLNLNKKIYQYAVDRNCYWQVNHRRDAAATAFTTRARLSANYGFNEPAAPQQGSIANV